MNTVGFGSGAGLAHAATTKPATLNMRIAAVWLVTPA